MNRSHILLDYSVKSAILLKLLICMRVQTVKFEEIRALI